jgi:hypothetical protein
MTMYIKSRVSPQWFAYLNFRWLWLGVFCVGLYVACAFESRLWRNVAPAALSAIGFYSFFNYGGYVGWVRRCRSLMAWADKMPTSMHMIDNDNEDEDRRVLAVNFRDGSMSTLDVPKDYTPYDDGGELMLKMLFGDTEEIPDELKQVWASIFSQ